MGPTRLREKPIESSWRSDSVRARILRATQEALIERHHNPRPYQCLELPPRVDGSERRTDVDREGARASDDVEQYVPLRAEGEVFERTA